MAPHDGTAIPGDDAPVFSVELELGELSAELLERAQQELGETTELRTQTLVEFREMINSKGDLSCRTDDEFLLRFLRCRRFNVEQAYKLLENYLNFKVARPDIHENVWPQKLKYLGDDDVIAVPPYKDQDGRRMIIFKIGNWSPSKYKITELFKASVVVQELALLEKASTILGGIVIFDLSGISLTHAWNITPAVADTMLDLLMRSFPLRIHAIHIVNQPMIFHMIYAVFKPLLSKRMQDRIFFHGSDMSSLHRHISPKRLPKLYGGAHEEFSYRLWFDNLERNPDITEALRRLGYHMEDKNVIDTNNTKINTF